MNADKYYNTIKDQSILVFNKSIEDLDTLGMVTDIKSNLKVWHTLTHQWQSSEMLNNALEELDISCIHLLFGFHRSSWILRFDLCQSFRSDGASYYGSNDATLVV
ncbi:hypothetical protein [Sphingobacterium multivorum]|uniref:hypothetical protein n=1 Tax=Sphingobacterium multivorum TaxID=28454 RepID=UPI00345ED2C1